MSVQRGASKGTPIVKGKRINHNFIKLYSALDGQT